MDEFLPFQNCSEHFSNEQMTTLALTFVKSLRGKPKDEELQLDCLEALCQITEDVLCTADMNDAEKYFGKYLWLEEIATAMYNFPKKDSVQETACRCLAALLKQYPSLCQFIGDDDEDDKFPVSRYAVAALKNPCSEINSTAVFHGACQAISAMATNCEILQQDFICEDCHQPILEKLSSSKDVNEQEAGLRVLVSFSRGQMGFKKRLLKDDILTYIINVLETFPNAPDLQEEAIILLATLASDLEVVRQQCIVEEIPVILLGVLKLSSHEQSLVEVTFETLGVMCESEGVPDILRKSDGIRLMIGVMHDHVDNRDIQTKGIVLLQLLVTNHSLNVNMFASLVSVVRSAMATFPQDIDIQTEACVIFHLLTENNEKISVDLVNLNIHAQFFKIFENFPVEESLLNVASECVYLLACTLDLKNPMLLSMCALGSLKAVECLIQLGANVNYGEDKNTPLCLACRAGDLELVNYLLTQGVADVHGALALSIELQRHNIAGFLLKHMGHDVEAGTITLTGLNLSSPQAEWLVPAMMGQCVYLSRFSSNEWWEFVENARQTRALRRRTRQLTATSFCSDLVESEAESFLSLDDAFRNDVTIATTLDDERPHPRTHLLSSDHPTTPSPIPSRSSLDSIDHERSDSLEPRRKRRLSSVSGTSIPCSWSDPRVTVTPDPRNYVTTPESGNADTITENHSVPSKSKPMPFRKTRSVTDLGITTHTRRASSDASDVEMVSQSYTPGGSKKTLKKAASSSALHKGSIKEVAPPGGTARRPRNPVHRLDLSCNEIQNVNTLANRSGILSSHLTSIEKLDLSQNRLATLPKVLNITMPRLTHLVLKHNKFLAIPPCVLALHSLEWLDMSNNHITKIAKPKSLLSSFVSHLNLSHNKINEFPVWLGDAFKLLSWLDLSHNLLCQLKKIPANLRKLKTLDLSNNAIQTIPEEFMRQMRELETFKAAQNNLRSLPDAVAPLLVTLGVVKLSQNLLIERAPFYLTKFVLLLPNVHTVDISSNGLHSVASPQAWASQGLKDLDVSNNKITHLDLTKGVAKWAFMSRLDLSNNQLKQVPKGIGQLKSLGQLSLSGNNRITSLPDEIGNLCRLWEFLHTGLKLNMNAAILRGRTRDLVGHFHARLRNSTPFPQRKLVVCGPHGAGKSTLLRCLLTSKAWKKVHVERRKSKRNASDCLEVKKFMIQDVKADCKCCARKNVTLTLRVWKFSGLGSSVSVHRCFLSEGDMHVLVYDVSGKVEEMDQLKPWLANIYDQCPNSGAILVGTHLDKIPPSQQKNHLKMVSQYVGKLHMAAGLPEIRDHFVVSCVKDDSRVDEVARRLLNRAMALNTKGYEINNHRVPRSFISLQGALEGTLTDNAHIVNLSFLTRTVQEAKLDISEEELNEAVLFLRQSGFLVNYAKPADKLNDLFFLWPASLASLISHVVQFLTASKGMRLIEREDLTKIITKQAAFAKSFLPQILRLLQVFEIILPVTSSSYLGSPCLALERPKLAMAAQLSRKAKSQPAAGAQLKALHRRYYMPYFPLGFWSRLVVHLCLHCEDMVDIPQQMSSTETKNCETTIKYWQKGFSKYWSDECNFTIEIWEGALDIIVPLNCFGRVLLGNLVHHIDTLLQEWFPALCGEDQRNGYPMIKKTTFCVSCQDHQFPMEDCRLVARSGSFIECPTGGAVNALTDQAPDILLAHIDQRYLIKEHELNYEPVVVLGAGSYGVVYRVKYKSKTVAAKVFQGKQMECDAALEYLEQEVRFLVKLRHPSIICLIGMCLRPEPVAVLELAPLGSLNAIFRRQQTLSRGLQHRIAMQVAEGLAFLHHHMIIYRDLKPHNILIFSLAAGTLINAKISDFGSARHSTPFGFISSEGTPGYRAPEVARGDTAYNEKADIFSLGMLLYELATGGKQPFNNLKFRSELDEAVICGRPLEPITMADSPPWPDMQDLLDNILVPEPESRPTADQVYERLSGPEFISFKNDIAVCKGQAVECMTVRCFTEDMYNKMEVWVGSGASDCSDIKSKNGDTPQYTSQLSRFDLSSTKPKGCKGTILRDGRIMAILAIEENMILVGTQTGNLWVYDARKEKFLYRMAELPDALLCLCHTSVDHNDLVLAGLANGQLALYHAWEFTNPQKTVRVIDMGADVCCKGMPILCMAVSKRRLFCAFGHNIVALRLGLPDIIPEFSWSVNGSSENHKGVVSNIVVDKHGIWSATKGSTRIQLWDLKTREIRARFNCEDLLAPCELSTRELRVVSLLTHNNVLWVGTGGGQILLVDTQTKSLLMTMCRHKYAVRCLTTAVLKEGGKPISLVLSGGLGFIARQSSPSRDTAASQDFGYVLVWDSGIHEEAKELEEYKIRRNEWLQNHTNK